jgi:UDP-N-acetylmuramate: L-alanyl-gamma-D-glutamyl-meso-diaminopimelate ligase
MHLHILGIAGTFMGGIAQLAKSAGHEVTGADRQVYPPMSTQLQTANIDFCEGFDPQQLKPTPDTVVVGNVMTRGQPIIEAMLNEGMNYTSGPQWLYENLLCDRWVLAVSGTHGKTSTASMLAWILEYAGLNPGFLIGGVPENFGFSARIGSSPFFVIEADEYDTAFFDKRSKFVHYHPRTLIINNLEFDHADIFPDLFAIQRQFHHLVRMVPGDGLIIHPENTSSVRETLDMWCWTACEPLSNQESSTDWRYRANKADCSSLSVYHAGEALGAFEWSQLGHHNASNALAAIVAARHVGVPPQHSIEALAKFKGIKRRMELRGEVNDIRVYDDFAHHPTAIQTTLEGLRQCVGKARILVVFEPRSNTMRMGVHGKSLGIAFSEGDHLFTYISSDINWPLTSDDIPVPSETFHTIDELVLRLTEYSQPGDHILVMSNGGFGGLHEKLLSSLAKRKIRA